MLLCLLRLVKFRFARTSPTRNFSFHDNIATTSRDISALPKIVPTSGNIFSFAHYIVNIYRFPPAFASKRYVGQHFQLC
jgi:hypothetical protein